MAADDLARVDPVPFVGKVTSHTVRGITKDNFHFGVRAVDEAGHRSQVRFPTAVLR